MRIDNKFYSIIQNKQNIQNEASSQEFSQILTQEAQKQQPKFIGNPFEDYKNGLISKEVYDKVDAVLSGARYVAGLALSQKMVGTKIEDYDVVSDKYGGFIKQNEVLENGNRIEKEEWLNSYKQVIENGNVIPASGKSSLDMTIDYLNKVLKDL